MKNTSSNLLRTISNAVYNNRTYQFWLAQIIGWGGLGMVTFFSLTLWYSTANWSYVSHIILQSLLGMMLSLPLRRTCVATWEQSFTKRVSIGLAAIVIVSFVWTLLRIQTFILITEEEGIWGDFGGWYFSSLLVYMCWTALYFGNRYYYQAQMEYVKRSEAAAIIKEEQLKRLSAENDARTAQLGMLRYQINPHFLFNTLNSISALVKLQENGKAQKMITQLGYFLRYSLDNNPAITISLQQEIEALMLYLDIERTRFGEKLVLDFDIDEQAKHAQVPSLLLQPLVENSVKYAISPNENGGVISIRAFVSNGNLQIELTDTGGGENKQRPASKTGRRVGLHNTLQRLKKLYNEAYRFDINLHPSGGLKIDICIPYTQA